MLYIVNTQSLDFWLHESLSRRYEMLFLQCLTLHGLYLKVYKLLAKICRQALSGQTSKWARHAANRSTKSDCSSVILIRWLSQKFFSPYKNEIKIPIISSNKSKMWELKLYRLAAYSGPDFVIVKLWYQPRVVPAHKLGNLSIGKLAQ